MINYDDLFSELNAGYIAELYERFRQDPESLDPQTREVFERWAPTVEARPPTPTPTTTTDIRKIVGTVGLAEAIRERGHMAARIDPLGSAPPGDPALELSTHGLSEADLAQLPASVVGGPAAAWSQNALQVVRLLRQVYTGTIGYEFGHVTDPEQRAWLRDAVESGRFRVRLGPSGKRALLDRLTQVETLERFLQRAYTGQKRFSIEGTDMLVPLLDEIICNHAESGVREVVIGMAHRGRLNVLAHILGKSYEAIMSEFQHIERNGSTSIGDVADMGWTGDVKYHLGARRPYRDRASNVVQAMVTLPPNPSHLEFVDPVVVGMTRAAQEHRGQPGAPEQDLQSAVAILIHGDAAFPGEGVVAETLNLWNLAGYRIGGTIHVIVNNQIGFTTEEREARSTLYASDLAKGFEIPIVHVNADDPEACLAAARLAHAYRERFHEDFLIDLVGYRRYGHNEGDDPTFTQPLMYKKIASHPTVREIWAQELDRQGVVSADEAEAMVQRQVDRLEEARSSARDVALSPAGKERRRAPGRIKTAVSKQLLVELNQALTTIPPTFKPNPKIVRLLERRRAAVASNGNIDWAQAEQLAFATILVDGTPIRLTGQDTARGTFSQRHLVLHDIETGQKYIPLQELPSAEASFAVYNSPLSEVAPLGFEYGYSVQAPDALVLWEAQFGDFANVAQVIIDQFIVSGRAKWNQSSDLVLLLPHGYEGQGPEHSSARLERFLQLAADENLRVVNCTTSAQYFHVLRRQAALLKTDARPLVIMTPKSLLRHPLAASPLSDLADGQFQVVIDDADAQQRRNKITRLVLCSGKLYTDLVSAEHRSKLEHVAIVRVEELYPFPSAELEAIIQSYPNLRSVVWAQEEPKNMGAWTFAEPRVRNVLPKGVELEYAGRPRWASTAEGTPERHAAEQAQLVDAAFGASAARERERARSVRRVV